MSFTLCILVLVSLLTVVIADSDVVLDPYDLSFYRKGAALGDSYASGQGAGNKLDDSGACERWDGSYSNLVAQQVGNSDFVFTNLACSGATFSKVTEQIGHLEPGQDFIIVSAGGNDADLTAILDHCVYSFSLTVHLDCDGKLAAARELVHSMDFTNRYRDMIIPLREKLAPGGKIYYVGYAKFFDTTDKACDKVSWHYWSFWQEWQYLTQARRQAMNDVVDEMNKVLREFIKYSGDSVQFVDYDRYLDMYGGRFCQPGQDEADGKSANRDTLFFYERETTDKPWLDPNDQQQWKVGSKRDNEVVSEISTVGASLGALIKKAITDNSWPVAVVRGDHANSGLIAMPPLDAAVPHKRGLPAIEASVLAPAQSDRLVGTTRLRSDLSPTGSVRWSNTTCSASVRVDVLHEQHSSQPSTSSAGSVGGSFGSWIKPSGEQSVLPTPRPTKQPTYWNSSSKATVSSEEWHSTLSRSRISRSNSAWAVASQGPFVATESPAAAASLLLSAGQSNRLPSAVWSSHAPPHIHTGIRSSGRLGSMIPVSIKISPSHTGSYRLPIWPSSRPPSPSSPPYPLTNNTSNNSTIGNVTSLYYNTGHEILSGSSQLGATIRILSNTSNNTSPRKGTVIADDTRILMSNGETVANTPDQQIAADIKLTRVFHPTQFGHAAIANLILYQMSGDRAQSLGIADGHPAAVMDTTGTGWLDAVGAACAGDSTDTWAGRDPMISAVSQFCADAHHLRAKQGQAVSQTYNMDTLDYSNVSISWSANSNLNQHNCKAWLSAVADSCDVPHGDVNKDNWKHGGLIKYHSGTTDATLQIEPLVMRRMWDGGKSKDGLKCADPKSRNYVTRDPLQKSVELFCKDFAALPQGFGYAGSEFGKLYYGKTPDEAWLAVSWPLGRRNYQVFYDECMYYMGLITDSCSLPDDANPMNWKHGGSYTDHNGIMYRIEPHHQRPEPFKKPGGNCHMKSKVAWYVFDVWGKGWDSWDAGQETLLPAMKKCGALNSWGFEYYDGDANDPDIEWHAWGALPPWVPASCPGNAVSEAGGKGIECQWF